MALLALRAHRVFVDHASHRYTHGGRVELHAWLSFSAKAQGWRDQSRLGMSAKARA
ncbi:hypothetical protein [Xenophilus azovorans]|uniref:hypothetical protein n=1 Tax=Xenophilus azovorans TaxID=151755 RepID=UPI0012EDA3A0|nr:hypothetical protein [Xenophilus azovorans]